MQQTEAKQVGSTSPIDASKLDRPENKNSESRKTFSPYIPLIVSGFLGIGYLMNSITEMMNSHTDKTEIQHAQATATALHINPIEVDSALQAAVYKATMNENIDSPITDGAKNCTITLLNSGDVQRGDKTNILAVGLSISHCFPEKYKVVQINRGKKDPIPGKILETFQYTTGEDNEDPAMLVVMEFDEEYVYDVRQMSRGITLAAPTTDLLGSMAQTCGFERGVWEMICQNANITGFMDNLIVVSPLRTEHGNSGAPLLVNGQIVGVVHDREEKLSGTETYFSPITEITVPGMNADQNPNIMIRQLLKDARTKKIK
jgi:hypothetical protein